MNIVQFWIVDTIVKHKTLRPIRLSMDEEMPEDMLVSDGEYNADDSFFQDLGSEEDDATSISSIKIQHKSATQAQLHRTLSQASNVSEDSLYELRTSNQH
jgi:hypothetical protein